MIDPKLLRGDPDGTAAVLLRKGFKLEQAAYREIEQRRKALQTEVEELRKHGNRNAAAIGAAKRQGEATDELLRSGERIKRDLETREARLAEVQSTLNTMLSSVPNLPDLAVPDGVDENDNVEFRHWGEVPQFSFEARDHSTLGEQLGMMDSEAATRLAGSRFTVLWDDLAKLQRALIRFMLELQIKQHGYREVYVPYIVNAECLYGTGQLPKFEEELFALCGDHAFYLIPTAEVPLTNLCRDTILEENELPLKWVAHTPCFRSEAGSYGKDTRGLIRQHQFEKIEMVQVVCAEDSATALEELTMHAEAVLQSLRLPYRMIELCAGELGFSSARTYDLEVWLPQQNCYREVSSCSNMTDFQARRMKARVRRGKGGTELVHTLNGSGLAVGRTLVAILENCQDRQGRVHIPEMLQPYMGGQEIIAKRDA